MRADPAASALRRMGTAIFILGICELSNETQLAYNSLVEFPPIWGNFPFGFLRGPADILMCYILQPAFMRLRLDCGTMAWICNGALREGTDPELIRTTGLFANS